MGICCYFKVFWLAGEEGYRGGEGTARFQPTSDPGLKHALQSYSFLEKSVAITSCSIVTMVPPHCTHVPGYPITTNIISMPGFHLGFCLGGKFIYGSERAKLLTCTCPFLVIIHQCCKLLVYNQRVLFLGGGGGGGGGAREGRGGKLEGGSSPLPSR